MIEDPVDTLPWADKPVWRGVDCGPGWFPIIVVLDEKLKAINPDYEVVQVKEKFGTLRYYVQGFTGEDFQQAQEVIVEAEQLSAITCEYCGQPGSMRSTGWMRTLCDNCDAERKAGK